MVDDIAFYDSMVRQDSYVLGFAFWNIGGDADASTAFDEVADYICSH